jgi:hypothetical protein
MKLFFLLFVNVLFILSCKKYQPAEPAFFIRSSPATIKTINNTIIKQGSGSNKVTDYFVYVNGQFQGVYPVGNLIPIPNKNQPVSINIYAGIKNNGIKETRLPYPSYDYFTLDTAVASGNTISKPFVFKYSSGIIFDWVEDFDSGTGLTLIRSATTAADATFKIASPEDCFEGKSIQIGTNSSISQAVQVESSISYPLPAGVSNVYLEINYKCNAPFTVGLQGDLFQKDALIINPQNSWNKIYVALANAVSSTPVSDRYKVYFKILRTNDYPNPSLFLDNIKLLYVDQ